MMPIGQVLAGLMKQLQRVCEAVVWDDVLSEFKSQG